MTPQTELEIKGTFYKHPFAELLVEIAQAGLNGSLRVNRKEAKCVIYFKGGQVVFAVSNARSTRLFDVLLRQGKLKKDDLVQIPNFSNDFEFTKYLIEKNFLTKADSDRLFADQIRGIVLDMLTWDEGEWTYSPHARIRDGLSFSIDMTSHLMNYSRCLSNDSILNRFRTLDETFRRSKASEMGVDLTPEEGFVLSRAEDGQLSASNLISLSAMPEVDALHTLYNLWLGGLLIRDNWNPAFSRTFVSAIRSAKFELKAERKERESTPITIKSQVEEIPPAHSEPSSDPAQKEPDSIIALEDYLLRVERAATYYDILGVAPKSDANELKRAYFHLAKNFHPDRYHSEGGIQLKRIQSAFTELAQAHETLKNPETREIYDYRMRKELVERENRQTTGDNGAAGIQMQQAGENFDRGLSLLMDDDPDGAVPFFARAAHFAPKNARYRAYYGKALSFDEKQRHKAESEMQAALKIDPNNVTYRIMLAEFFIQFNLMKRAEGELNRLLAIFPSNREARELLNSIKVQS